LENQEKCKVIPVIIRHTEGWTRLPIGALQGFPKDRKPLDTFPNPDCFWGDVKSSLTREIDQILVER